MKILIATDTYFPNINGAAYFTYRLAGALAKKGHTVFVICPSQSFRDTVTEEKGVVVYGICSIPVLIHQNFRISPGLLSKKSIYKIIKEVSPDVVHIQSHFLIGAEVTTIAKKFDIPVVGTNHFMPENFVHYFHLPKIFEKPFRKAAWKHCIKIFEQFDAVTTPTKTAAELLRKAGFKKEVLPLSCGIDLDRFKPTNDGLYLSRRYGIPTHKPVLLFVGRLDKEKRIEVIARALPIILKKTDAQLVLVGIGKQKSPLESLVRELGLEKAVTFTGFISDKDLQDIYRVANIFIIAGIAELQSIVTMEAMASGLPVVAVNALALPELVHDGENGYLFNEDDSQMLAERVISILSNPTLQNRMKAKSLEIIRAHSIEKTITAFESVYNRVINEQ